MGGAREGGKFQFGNRIAMVLGRGQAFSRARHAAAGKLVYELVYDECLVPRYSSELTIMIEDKTHFGHSE
jgi:hypothetical protein